MTFTKKEQIIILAIVLLMTLFFAFKIAYKEIIKSRQISLRTNEDLLILDESSADDFSEDALDLDEFIMVHISGQVYTPGVVEIELGKRVVDAVALCGGLKKDADLDRINLAKKLVDEEKIYIPQIGEEISDNIALTTSSEKTEGKVNINTCTKGDLETLPGIGTVLADRIIQHRETNTFKNIEEIKNVSGIGDKKYESIKDLIIAK